MSTITLPNIRVGSDLQVRVRLKDGGVAIDWSTLQNIKACIYSDAQRALAGRCSISIDAEDSTLLVCNYAANKPQYLGANRVVISVKYLGETKTYDKPAFTFVRWTDDQAGEQITIDDPDVDVEIEVEDISSSILQEAVDAAFAGAERANEAAAAAEHMVDIHTGPEGKSAYEVAVEEGYTGTEEEWLASLVGPQGPQGIQGETGEAAGFGAVSVTLQEDGGQPGATVAASGPDTAKNLAFAFKNLKGEKGDKGDQGNTGSSVDYPFELVNNETTDDATKAHTAAGAKRLKDEVSQLEAKVTDLEQVVGTTDKSIPLTVDKTGYYVYNDGRLMTSPNFNLSSPVHLKRGERIAVRTAAWDAVAVIAKILESGATPYQALVVGTSVGSLFVDDFSYTATEECDVVISGYVNQFPATATLTYASTIATLVDTVGQLDEDMEIVKSERVLDFKDETITVTISETGMAVKDDGTVVSSSNFNISAPIKIRRGQKITVAASGWTSIAIIAKVLPSGYMPLALGTSSGSLVNDTFTYVATEDCNIVITSYVNYYPATAGLSFSNTVVSQQSALTKLGGATAIPVNPVRGGWYNTYGDGTVGSIATLEYTENIDWESLNILVNAGDVFYVTGRGGNSPRLWAFLDATTNEILAFSGHVDAGDKTRIVAPKDCRLVINIQILLAQPYGIWKEQADFGSIQNIENFSRLNSVPSIPIDKINYFDGFAGIIHHWGFIGDSLMSGFFDNTGASNYEYSWGQRMCKKLGVEGYNFSRGGQTVKGWIEDASSQDPVFFNRSWGGAKTNLKQAYIIGLGVNDKVESYGVGDVSTDVGTYDPTTDTDTNANTYAGYYAGIIQRVRSVQPNAPIFLVNMPQGGGWNSVVPYNEVIADLVAEFDNTYLIDLFSSLPIFGTYHYETSKFWTGGHLNPAGYEYIASVIMQYIDWIIRNNYAAFSDVNLIPFTE